MARRDDPEKMAEMARWLEAASKKLKLDTELIKAHQGRLLGLIEAVAHGPSRPAAPLTAFLVGYASAAKNEDPDRLVALLKTLAENWESPALVERP